LKFGCIQPEKTDIGMTKWEQIEEKISFFWTIPVFRRFPEDIFAASLVGSPQTGL
jgi:hypothetical protein